MKILIFEDELHTATRLVQLLKKYSSDIIILGIIGSVKEGVAWFHKNSMPDLIFQDISLNDGNCFEIFEDVEVKSPIIFTTAYNEYALKSFKVNSIDYILKPYDYSDIKNALDKFRDFSEMFLPIENSLLKQIAGKETPEIKRRFLVKIGDKYHSIKARNIALLKSEDSLTFAYTFDNTRFPVNNTIEQLAVLLDTYTFFQVSRKYILNIECISNIHTYFNNRLKLELNLDTIEEIIVSRERVKDFKAWLDR